MPGTYQLQSRPGIHPRRNIGNARQANIPRMIPITPSTCFPGRHTARTPDTIASRPATNPIEKTRSCPYPGSFVTQANAGSPNAAAIPKVTDETPIGEPCRPDEEFGAAAYANTFRSGEFACSLDADESMTLASGVAGHSTISLSHPRHQCHPWLNAWESTADDVDCADKYPDGRKLGRILSRIRAPTSDFEHVMPQEPPILNYSPAPGRTRIWGLSRGVWLLVAVSCTFVELAGLFATAGRATRWSDVLFVTVFSALGLVSFMNAIRLLFWAG